MTEWRESRLAAWLHFSGSDGCCSEPDEDACLKIVGCVAEILAPNLYVSVAK